MDELNVYYVYVLFRPWDGTPFYIGKGKGDRWLCHEDFGERHKNKHVANIFKRARRLGLDVPKIKVREGLSEADAFIAEIALISAIGRSDKKRGTLANRTDGGEGSSGLVYSQEHREKIRAASIGRYHSEEARRLMSEIAKRRPEEHLQKISVALKGRPLPEWHKQKLKLAHKSRKPISEETRAKMRTAQQARRHRDKVSVETRARTSASITAWHARRRGAAKSQGELRQ